MTTSTVLRVAVFLVVAGFGHATVAAADCVTKPAALAKALNGKDAYTLARAEAVKWNADSVLTRMQTTSEGPVNAQGQSSDWSLQFFSAAAQKLNMMSFTSGTMTCFAIDRTSGGRTILATDATIFDTQQLLGVAEQAGGAALDHKANAISAGLVQNPGSGTIWHIDYKATGSGLTVLKVVIDATRGVVTYKNPK